MRNPIFKRLLVLLSGMAFLGICLLANVTVHETLAGQLSQWGGTVSTQCDSTRGLGPCY